MIKKKYVVCEDIKGKKYKVLTKELVFRPSVYGVIIENNKVLLVKQWDGYDFPGGGVELDESIEQALKREVWEETGLKIKIKHIVACESSFFRMPFAKKDCNCVLMYYLCQKISGKVTNENFDKYEKIYADKPEWIDIKNIKNIKFYNSADSLGIIKKALKMAKK